MFNFLQNRTRNENAGHLEAKLFGSLYRGIKREISILKQIGLKYIMTSLKEMWFVMFVKEMDMHIIT